MRGAEWSSEDDYSPVPGARRYEDWEFAYALLLASAEAARYAVGVGIERTQSRVTDLAARLRQGLSHDGLRLLDRGDELAALVTVEVAGWEADAFKRELDAAGVNSSVSFREYARFDFDTKDVDWCLRAERAGWKRIFVPEAHVMHHHGASSRGNRLEMVGIYNASRCYYFLKFGGVEAAGDSCRHHD